jgi:hypothetical protein
VRAAPKPIVPAGIQEVFVPAIGSSPFAASLYGSGKVRFTDAKRDIDVVQDVNAVTQFVDRAVPVNWDAATQAPVAPEQLVMTAPSGALFEPPPAAALDPRRYAGWSRDFVDWIVRSQALTIYSAKSLKLTSAAGESERDFRVRVQMAAREARDAQVERLRAKYATKIARATEKVRKAEETVGREQQQVGQQRLQTAVSVGATIFGALLGRKMVSTSTLGRATTAARGVSRSMKETEDVAKAQERVTLAQRELAELRQQIEEEAAAVSSTADPQIETVTIKPKRGSVDVRLVALVWMPQ